MAGNFGSRMPSRDTRDRVEAEDAIAFKLTDPDAHAQALALAGAHLFDPSGKGRPFKEWVVVPPAHAAQWGQFAESAVVAVV